MKQIIEKIISRTFNRMTTYLAVFNFCLLCAWLYDSQMGDIIKDMGLRVGDVILIVLFVIIVASALEMLILGLKGEDNG